MTAEDAGSYDTALQVVERRVDETVASGKSWLVAVAGLLTVLVGSASLQLGHLFPALASLAFGVLLVVAGRASTTTRSRLTTKQRQVKVSAAGIEIEDGTTIPAASIADAYFQPRADGASTVCCVDRKGSVLFEAAMESASIAEDFLRALGPDIVLRRQRFVVQAIDRWSKLRALPLLAPAILATFVLLGGGATTLVMGALALQVAFFMAARAFVGDTAVEVGADGLLVGAVRSLRFIPYDQIRRVEALGPAVRVVLSDGEIVNLLTSGRDADLRRDALLVRIERARAARAERGNESAPLTERLARRDRPVGEWRRALATIQEPEADYRHPPVHENDLWRVLENTSAPEEVRAAAAVALRTQQDAEQRLHVAADAVASPKLRIAFETAADPQSTELALDEALQALEADVARKL